MLISKLKRRWRALIHRGELEQQLDQEFRFHLERDIARNIEAGMHQDEARYAALRTFGNVDQSKEECRDARGVRFIEEFWQDVRYGLRMLRKDAGFTAVATLILALGIGATTAIFSVVNTVLLHPLPYKDPDRLVFIWDQLPKLALTRNIVSPANYFDWQQQSRVFENMGAYTEGFFNLTDSDRGNPERIAGVIATPSLLQTLGVEPVLGRNFTSEEARTGGSANPVIISHSLWQRRMGWEPDPVGENIGLNGGQYTVIGVMPREFMFSGKRVDVFLPFKPNAEQISNRRGRYLTVIARLKEGLEVKQAQAEMDAITARLAQQYPDTNKDSGAGVVALEEEILGGVRRSLFLLLGAVGFLFLITCVNAGNLLFARFTSRGREIAIRTALGATRLRIVNQLLVESLLITFLGGILGLLLAKWGVDLILGLSPTNIPRIGDVRLDNRVFGFAAAVSIVTGLIFGLLPALRASQTNLGDSLKESAKVTAARTHLRARGMLLILEVALSLVLLVGAGLMIKSFVLLQQVDPGFAGDRTIAMDLSLAREYHEPQKRARFFQDLVNRVEALSGVHSAGVTDNLPLSGEDASRPFTIGESLSTEKLAAEHRRVSPHYFNAMGISVLRGRVFTEHDTDQAPGVVIINEALARQFLPNQEPLGRQLIIDDGPPRPREIIGVIRNVKHFSLDGESKAEMYVPHVDRPWPNMTLVVRTTSSDPQRLVTAIRSEVATIDKGIPVANVKTVNQYLTAATAQRRFSMFLLGSFAALALLLVVIGIYGLTSYNVAQRTREIGIRMALGAQKTEVLRLIISQGTKLTLIGTVTGLLAAFGLTRLMESLLFEVSATDWTTFAGVTLLLAGISLAACYIPARRATKVNPLDALRHE